MKPEGGPVAVEMPVEVVLQHVPELDPVQDVGARGDHVTTGQGLVKVRVISAIELIDDHLPDWVGARRAVLGVAVALVGHAVVEGVGPDGDTAEWRGDGGVIDKELIRHHLELLVASDAEEGCPHSDHRAVSDVGKTLHNQPGPSHLSEPVVIRALSPITGVVLVRNGKDPNLVTLPVELLHRGIVCVLVRNVKCSLERAAVRVLPLAIEEVPG